MREVLLENIRLRDVNPRVCGREACAPGHSFGPAVRGYYLIHYVISGKGVLYNARGAHPAGRGQAFVIRPGETTTYTANTESPWEYLWAGFECGFSLDGLLEDDVFDFPAAEGIFLPMMNLPDKERPEWYVCGKIYELLSALRARRETGESRKELYVRRAVNHIESNYTRELEVGAIAAALGLNRSYFSRIFKELCGKSPQSYFVDTRLAKAAGLLARTGLPIGEVAQMTGYPDAVNFCRMFKRRYGVPPGAYGAKKNDD